MPDSNRMKNKDGKDQYKGMLHQNNWQQQRDNSQN